MDNDVLFQLSALAYNIGNTCEAGMMCGTAENRILEWRARVAVRQNSRRKKVLDASAWPLGCFCAARCAELAGIIL